MTANIQTQMRHITREEHEQRRIADLLDAFVIAQEAFDRIHEGRTPDARETADKALKAMRMVFGCFLLVLMCSQAQAKGYVDCHNPVAEPPVIRDCLDLGPYRDTPEHNWCAMQITKWKADLKACDDDYRAEKEAQAKAEIDKAMEEK